MNFKTNALIVLIASCFAVHSPAAGVGVFGSYWDPSDLSSETGGGLLLRLNAGNNLLMDVRGAYYSFNRQDVVPGAGDSADLEIIPLELSLISRMAPAPDFVPYVGGGIGYYIADGEYMAGGQKATLDIDNEIGFSLMAGVDIKINRTFNLFADAKYVWVTFDKVRTGGNEAVPTDFDIKMNGLVVSLGLIMRW